MEHMMATVVLLLSITATLARPDGQAVSRNLLQNSMFSPAHAPAPAPFIAPRPAVTGMFTFSGSMALFYNGTTLRIEGVPNITEWITYPPNPSAGTFSKAAFFSKALASSGNGDWVGGPQAMLQGTSANGTSASVLLTLHAPSYRPAADEVTLAYRALAANESALPATGGVANSVLQAVASQSLSPAGSSSPSLLTAVPEGTAMYNVTVFIDVVNVRQYTSKPAAGDKAGLINIPLSNGWGPYDYYYGDPYYGYYNG